LCRGGPAGRKKNGGRVRYGIIHKIWVNQVFSSLP
jgi:hypothetical protein